MARNTAWGIDIGDSAVKAVRLRRVGDSVVIQDYRTIPCEARSEEASGSEKEDRVRNALLTLQREVKLAGATVVVSMQGRYVFPRFITLPPVDRKRIPEIVRHEAKAQMPFPIEEVIWDYQPMQGTAGPGEETEVALFAIKKATVYGFLTNLQLARLKPDIVQITPLALYNFLVHDRTIEVGTVAIDIGSGNTDLVIIDGDRFWTRSVSISGNDITRALQEKYQISFKEAEKLKRKAATSRQADKLLETMRPILDDLIGEIQRSIGYYKAQTRNFRVEKMILLGNAFKLHGLVDYFHKSFDCEVSLIDGLQQVEVGPGADAAEFEPELPNYGVALGLALQGLGLARAGIDMMPDDLRRPFTAFLKRLLHLGRREGPSLPGGGAIAGFLMRLLRPSKETRVSGTEHDNCAICRRSLHERSMMSSLSMSPQELFAALSPVAQVGRAMECESCNIDICALCCTQAAARRGVGAPCCPRCGNPVHLRGALRLPGL